MLGIGRFRSLEQLLVISLWGLFDHPPHLVTCYFALCCQPQPLLDAAPQPAHCKRQFELCFAQLLAPQLG